VEGLADEVVVADKEEDDEEGDAKEASARLFIRGKLTPCLASLSCAHFTIRSRCTNLASFS